MALFAGTVAPFAVTRPEILQSSKLDRSAPSCQESGAVSTAAWLHQPQSEVASMQKGEADASDSLH